MNLKFLMMAAAAILGPEAAAYDRPAHVMGVASWFGMECKGLIMANGEPFDPNKLVCASWDHPFGTRLRVTNVKTGRFVNVIVADRGPARRLKRLIDLSMEAFRRIAPLKQGLVDVRVEVIR